MAGTLERRIMSVDAYFEELDAQGLGRLNAAVKCPMCGTVQSMASLITAGVGPDMESVAPYIGFSCVGRWTHRLGPVEAKRTHPGQGCNWTLGGLLRTHTLEVLMQDGSAAPVFAPATPEEARALHARLVATPSGTVPGEE